MGKLVACGCGKHHIGVDRKHTVLWDGVYWDARCAFEQAILENREPLPERLRRIVEKLECAECGKPLGKSYRLFGDNVYHSTCLYDIGGEG